MTRDSAVLDEELYKHLIQENAKYMEKVHQTWNQKLMIVGAMAAFIVANADGFEKGAPLPLRIVMLAIPIMCIMLDAHLVEKVLHARIISCYLIREFEEGGSAGAWSSEMWGFGPERPRGLGMSSLAGLRSLTTTVVTIVPSVLVMFSAAFVVAPEYLALSIFSAFLISTAYALAALFVWRRLLDAPDTGAVSKGRSERSE